jgi:energy-converting hydrogenase Eha subunit B
MLLAGTENVCCVLVVDVWVMIASTPGVSESTMLASLVVVVIEDTRLTEFVGRYIVTASLPLATSAKSASRLAIADDDAAAVVVAVLLVVVADRLYRRDGWAACVTAIGAATFIAEDGGAT